MKRTVAFSPCRTYRYALGRWWGDSAPAVFIGLNPSTADETVDDPTIRRCIGFAKSWGCGGLVMLNLFAYRSTDPKKLRDVPNPIGPDNDQWLLSYVGASKLVAAWGVHGTLWNRDRHVKEILPRLECLGVTKDGHPRHPLYLPGNSELRSFSRG